MSEEKNYIIDPLTSLCKVALLHFMPDKTRLAISHYVLYIDDYTSYQWMGRMIKGDSRVDIANLYPALYKTVKWYLLENPEKIILNKETDDSIKIITMFAIKGLIKLQTVTYQNDMAIKIILQYLINMLKDALANEWKDENCIKTENSSNVLSDKIKNNYEVHTINSISKMLVDAEKIDNSQDDINALIDCAHKLLLNRDSAFVKLMKDINTNL